MKTNSKEAGPQDSRQSKKRTIRKTVCERVLMVFFLLFMSELGNLSAQQIGIRQLVESNASWESYGIRCSEEVKEFYKLIDYQPAWHNDDKGDKKAQLFELLGQSPDYGLDEKEYQFEFIHQYKDSLFKTQAVSDIPLNEMKLTDAAIHFFRDLLFGNTSPSFSYVGFSFSPEHESVAALLSRHMRARPLRELVDILSPPMAEIRLIQQSLMQIRKIISEPTFKEEPVVSIKADKTNKLLLRKFYHLGLVDSLNIAIPDSSIKRKVKEAQHMFGLLDDGVLRSTFLKELNIPLSLRMRELTISINYYRWLYCLSLRQPVVVVNIPAAFLKVYKGGKAELQMRIIAGKPSTPTPTLLSKITEVILYPYWIVPNSIVTKELLPAIRSNPYYLTSNNFQVLSRQGKVLDPSTINWSAINPGNFPYIIRQSTGCDNALGILKLNFFNPYTVYLHDTPSKGLFMLQKRFFSHGCMRMEKPIELGRFVLGRNTAAIDTFDEKKCLLNKSPVFVPVEDHLPVVVWYNPAGLDATGRLVFFEDIYRKFR